MALPWMLNRLAGPRIEERQQTHVGLIVDVRVRRQILIGVPFYHGVKPYLTERVQVVNLISDQQLNFDRERAKGFCIASQGARSACEPGNKAFAFTRLSGCANEGQESTITRAQTSFAFWWSGPRYRRPGFGLEQER